LVDAAASVVAAVRSAIDPVITGAWSSFTQVFTFATVTDGAGVTIITGGADAGLVAASNVQLAAVGGAGIAVDAKPVIGLYVTGSVGGVAVLSGAVNAIVTIAIRHTAYLADSVAAKSIGSATVLADFSIIVWQIAAAGKHIATVQGAMAAVAAGRIISLVMYDTLIVYRVVAFAATIGGAIHMVVNIDGRAALAVGNGITTLLAVAEESVLAESIIRRMGNRTEVVTQIVSFVTAVDRAVDAI